MLFYPIFTNLFGAVRRKYVPPQGRKRRFPHRRAIFKVVGSRPDRRVTFCTRRKSPKTRRRLGADGFRPRGRASAKAPAPPDPRKGYGGVSRGAPIAFRRATYDGVGGSLGGLRPCAGMLSEVFSTQGDAWRGDGTGFSVLSRGGWPKNRRKYQDLNPVDAFFF